MVSSKVEPEEHRFTCDHLIARRRQKALVALPIFKRHFLKTPAVLPRITGPLVAFSRPKNVFPIRLLLSCPYLIIHGLLEARRYRPVGSRPLFLLGECFFGGS